MLAIRLQRLGRKGYPVYRLAVQEAQRHPSSGRVVAYVGTYNPHTKEAKVQVEVAQKYLDNGAQPSPRVVKLLEEAGVKLPNWVTKAAVKQKAFVTPKSFARTSQKKK
jgi:small subunit ribosomal protein S16